MKTKEDILDELTEGRKGLFNNDVQVSFDDSIKAMQEYADQQTEQLKKQLEDLKYKLDVSDTLKQAALMSAETYRRNLNRSQLDYLLEIDRHKNHIKVLQSQLTEKDKEHKEHVEKLCRNIRILEERVKDGDKELSEQIEATNRNAEKGLLAVMELSELKAKHNGVKVFRNVQTASRVELILKPEHMNTVFTWKQIQDAIMKDDI